MSARRMAQVGGASWEDAAYQFDEWAGRLVADLRAYAALEFWANVDRADRFREQATWSYQTQFRRRLIRHKKLAHRTFYAYGEVQ